MSGHESFSQHTPGLVEKVTTSGSHSQFELFATGAGGGGIYTEVAHGEGSSVDLAGLQAQIAQLPTVFTGLI